MLLAAVSEAEMAGVGGDESAVRRAAVIGWQQGRSLIGNSHSSNRNSHHWRPGVRGAWTRADKPIADRRAWHPFSCHNRLCQHVTFLVLRRLPPHRASAHACLAQGFCSLIRRTHIAR